MQGKMAEVASAQATTVPLRHQCQYSRMLFKGLLKHRMRAGMYSPEGG